MASSQPDDIDSNAKTTGEEEQINHAIKPKEDLEEASGENHLVKACSLESWTIIDKDEMETDIDEDQSSYLSYKKKSLEGDLKETFRESDSESIEVISEDEFHATPGTSSSIPLNPSTSFPSDSISFPSPSTSQDSLSLPSLTSQVSSAESILSDGIPITDSDKTHQAEQPLYVWNNVVGIGDRLGEPDQDGNNDAMEQELDGNDELEHEEPAHVLMNNEPVDEEIEDDPIDDIVNEYIGADIGAVRQLDHGEPGYDLDDDGLPGAPLQPLQENADLYPSQELVEDFPLIERGEVYKHSRNRNLNVLLSGLLAVVLAMVIGLGVGHFRGLSERMEVQEMYEIIQEEKLETITDELVTCITGEEGMGGDDQELDERVIVALRDENEQLRDQLQNLKSNLNGQGEDAMLVILKNRIKTLMAANSDLEGEVARLKSRKSLQNDFSNIKVEQETLHLPEMFETLQGSGGVDKKLEDSKDPLNFDDFSQNEKNGLDQSGHNDKYNPIMEPNIEPQNKLPNDNHQHMTEHPKSSMEFENNPENYYPDDNGESITDDQKPVTKFGNIVNHEVSNLIIGLEKKWEDIKNQWEKIDEIMKTVDKNEENTPIFVKERNTSKEMQNENYNDWNSRRGEGRQRLRVNNARSDWLFQRAKYRRDVRHEEKKSNWYFENKHDSRKNNKDYHRTCFKDECQADDKEKANKRKKFAEKSIREGSNDEWDYKRKHKKEKGENKWKDTEEWRLKKNYKDSERKPGKKEKSSKWDSNKYKKSYKHGFDTRKEKKDNKRGEWASKKDKKKDKNKVNERNGNEEDKEIYKWDKESEKYVKKHKYETEKKEKKRGEWDSKKYKKKYNPKFHDKYEHRIQFPEEDKYLPEAHLNHYQDRIKRWVQDYY